MTDACNRFREDGYVIFKSLISQSDIETLRSKLSRTKEKRPVIYTQSTHSWESLPLDDQGMICESLLNPSLMVNDTGLSSAISNIIYSNDVRGALGEVLGIDAQKVICCWQDMLFEKSTATLPHIDSWYLDTVPFGGVIGCWVALERIRPEGGNFYIVEGSHKEDWRELYSEEHDTFTKKINEYVEKNRHKIKDILLEPGDVVLWGSTLIHGSKPQAMQGHSRLSLTAHYFLPSSALYTSRKVYSKQSVLKRLRRTQNIGFCRFRSRFYNSPYIRYVAGFLLSRLHSLQFGPGWDMRNGKY